LTVAAVVAIIISVIADGFWGKAVTLRIFRPVSDFKEVGRRRI